MRIQIVTAGTLGSVAPYTGLGHRLRTEGHYVEVVTHAKFSGVVACCGLQMRVLEADPFEQLIGAHNKFHHGDRSPAGVLRLIRASQHAALGLVDGILDAVDPTADLILLSTIVAPIGTVVAQYHGIPSMGVFLQPDTPTTAFSPCVTAWKPPGNGNRVRGRVVHAALDSLYGPANRRLHAGWACRDGAATACAESGRGVSGPSGTDTALPSSRARWTGTPSCGSSGTGGLTHVHTGQRPLWLLTFCRPARHRYSSGSAA